MRFVGVSLAITLTLGLPVARLSAQATTAAPTQPIVPSRDLIRRVFSQRSSLSGCGTKPGIHYITVVSVEVDSAGKPGNTQVAQSSGQSCLDDVALAAVKEAEFAPAKGEDGKPIASAIGVTVEYPFHPAPTPEQIAARHAAMPQLLFHPEVSLGKCKLTETINVTVHLTVKADGTADGVSLRRPSGDKCLNNRAVELVSQYRFSPGMKDGQPIDTPLDIMLNFQKF